MCSKTSVSNMDVTPDWPVCSLQMLWIQRSMISRTCEDAVREDAVWRINVAERAADLLYRHGFVDQEN